MNSAFEQLPADDQDLACRIARGMTVKEIAFSTGRTRKAVESSAYRLKKKLKVKDRVDVARIVIDAGRLDPDSLEMNAPPPEVLTNRQREILALVGLGLRMNEIAERSGLKPKAAGSHKYRAMHTLGLSDRIEVLQYCLKYNLTPETAAAMAVPESTDPVTGETDGDGGPLSGPGPAMDHDESEDAD